ncbi:MAG: TIGR00730 family Rossman fold protein [Pseudomonadota bacterium]
MRICVFCGSSPGRKSDYRATAEDLGRRLADRGIGVVYGGASVGLMGAVADGALAAGGEVIGVLPEALRDLEIAHEGLSELKVVGSMHERKMQMADLSDAFIALPGGVGTLEEAFEILTWSQLAIHSKPIGLLNVGGFYDGLSAFLDHLVEEAFLRPVHRAIMINDDDPDRLVDRLLSAEIPTDRKWVDELRR